jgi:hypothetical protein
MTTTPESSIHETPAPRPRHPHPRPSLPSSVASPSLLSSPVKPTRIPTSLVDIKALPEALDKTIDPNFVRDHLSKPPTVVWQSADHDSLVVDIKKIKSGSEVQMYPKLCKLFTEISKTLHGITFT